MSDRMKDGDPQPPAPKPSAVQQARQEREAAALRENLRRRKEQDRARKQPKGENG